ncbi:hypothetical protein BDQ17DRAFT_1313282 [Cyathus striatus]|nr:hypothetical protein BDQ17DRAFT_1313282 [Cyathus striatus]
MSAKFSRVAICGGGIGGLVAAAFVSENPDIQVDIYESKPEISSLGTAVAIWKRSWQVLVKLNLGEEVRKKGIPLPKEGEARGPIFRKSDQSEGFDFHNHIMPYGPTGLPRPVLMSMLESKLPQNCHIHVSKRFVSYETKSDGSIKLAFADGTEEEADVLIGADGVHSAARAVLFNNLIKADLKNADYAKFIEPIFSGTYAYRSIVHADKLKATNPEHQALVIPKIKHVVTHPIGKVISVICYYTVESGEGTHYDRPWVTDVSLTEVIDHYKGWESELIQLLEHAEAPLSRWAVHVVKDLPFITSGSVALLGDAAHAMTPHQGVGGGQAIEDAYILGKLLANHSTRRAEDILRVYEKVRLPFAQQAAEKSRVNGIMYEFLHANSPKDPKTPEELTSTGETIGKSFQWLAEGSCDEDLQQAEALLQ